MALGWVLFVLLFIYLFMYHNAQIRHDSAKRNEIEIALRIKIDEKGKEEEKSNEAAVANAEERATNLNSSVQKLIQQQKLENLRR